MSPRAGGDPRVLLLHGEESFLVEEEAKRVLDAWKAELVSDFGFEALDPGGLNATKLRDAVRQLSPYHAPGFPRDRDALPALLAGGHEEEVFRLTDNRLPRPSGDAFRVARSLVRGGESPTVLAWRVSRQLAMVLAVRARRDRGESLAEVQKAMSEHPFRIQKAFEAAGSVDSARLEEGLKALLAYEWEVKSGQLDAELGLDGVLARL